MLSISKAASPKDLRMEILAGCEIIPWQAVLLLMQEFPKKARPEWIFKNPGVNILKSVKDAEAGGLSFVKALV